MSRQDQLRPWRLDVGPAVMCWQSGIPSNRMLRRLTAIVSAGISAASMRGRNLDEREGGNR
jgi:hypothetical protein